MPDQLVKKKSEYEVVGDLSSLRDKSPVQNGWLISIIWSNELSISLSKFPSLL